MFKRRRNYGCGGGPKIASGSGDGRKQAWRPVTRDTKIVYHPVVVQYSSMYTRAKSFQSSSKSCACTQGKIRTAGATTPCASLKSMVPRLPEAQINSLGLIYANQFTGWELYRSGTAIRRARQRWQKPEAAQHSTTSPAWKLKKKVPKMIRATNHQNPRYYTVSLGFAKAFFGASAPPRRNGGREVQRWDHGGRSL